MREKKIVVLLCFPAFETGPIKRCETTLAQNSPTTGKNLVSFPLEKKKSQRSKNRLTPHFAGYRNIKVWFGCEYILFPLSQESLS